MTPMIGDELPIRRVMRNWGDVVACEYSAFPSFSKINTIVCSLPDLELVAEIDRKHEYPVLLVLADQYVRIIDPPIAEVDIFECASDVHALAQLVLSADGKPDLSINREVGCSVASAGGRRVIGKTCL